jgi:ribosome assembly protein YihI (activator of Der GTPase)
VFEQDYVMRLIKEMVRAILKLLFNIDTDSPTSELLEDSEKKATLDTLLDMIDDGKVNEAENEIYELTENLDQNYLKVALLFYSYLNDKSDEFLEDNNFSRDEVKEGLETIVSRYGLNSIASMFLQ